MENLTHIWPCFMISDLNNSLPFYVEKLGFAAWHIAPADNPFFAIVGRDKISIMLKAIGTPAPNRTRHEWAPWDAYIGTANPDVLFEEYTAAGVEFSRPLKVDDDGLLGFEVADPDGYILFFGRPNK
jgi:catechol 2,3-dioxygenase-like lactoylglutathione lyase family enzyme